MKEGEWKWNHQLIKKKLILFLMHDIEYKTTLLLDMQFRDRVGIPTPRYPWTMEAYFASEAGEKGFLT